MCLQQYTETDMRLYITICVLFQVKCYNTNAYALISYGLSKAYLIWKNNTSA